MCSNHNCLAVISLNSTLKKDEHKWLQNFWQKKKKKQLKLIRHIIDIIFTYNFFLIFIIHTVSDEPCKE